MIEVERAIDFIGAPYDDRRAIGDQKENARRQRPSGVFESTSLLTQRARERNASQGQRASNAAPGFSVASLLVADASSAVVVRSAPLKWYSAMVLASAVKTFAGVNAAE